MRKILTLATMAALAIPAFTVPTAVSAQSYREYGRGQSPCNYEKKQAEKKVRISSQGHPKAYESSCGVAFVDRCVFGRWARLSWSLECSL